MRGRAPKDSCIIGMMLVGMMFVSAGWAIDPAPGYVGSDRCTLCHPGIASQWKTTLHSTIYMPVVPENFISNWSGDVTLSDAAKGIPATTFTLNNNGGNGPFTVTVLGQTFTVDRVHGGKPIAENEDPKAPNTAGKSMFIGKQRYHTKFGDTYMILPLQWNPVANADGKDKGWVAYNLADWIGTDGTLIPKVEAQSEERRCAGCHQTGVQVAFNETSKRYELGRIEENIACESCHGPGSEHAMTADKAKIVNPSKLATTQQKFDTCGQCHSRVTSIEKIGGRDLEFGYNNGRAFKPGDLLADFAHDAGGYWPGGISKQHHQQSHDYVGTANFEGSAHAKAGLTCWSCHNAHGSNFEHDLKVSARDNGLCLQCHAAKFPNAGAVEAHSKHSAANSASPRCVDCHMSGTQKSAVDNDTHQHSFKVLNPAQTLTLNQPNACAMCHRSYNGITDTAIGKWNEESDLVINRWLDVEYGRMFGRTKVNEWALY